MRIFAISGNFRRVGVDIIGIKNQIVEAESEVEALRIICRELGKRYYDIHKQAISVEPDYEHIRIECLGFDLMEAVRNFPDTVTLEFLGRYAEKFTWDNLEQIAELTKSSNEAAHQWAKDRQKKSGKKDLS